MIDRQVDEPRLIAMSGAERLALYNECAAVLGRPAVRKFADSKTAVRRTLELLAALPPEEPAPTAEVVQLAPKKKERKPRRGPWFVFKPKQELREPQVSRDANKPRTCRRRVFDLMRSDDGCTLRQSIDIYNEEKQVDLTDVTTEAYKEIYTTGYEGIRCIHYNHGYGLRWKPGTEHLPFMDRPVQAYTPAEEKQQADAA